MRNARGNEIFLMHQPRPLHGIQTDKGWTPETIADRVLLAMELNFTALENLAVVFFWGPA